jgi:pyruvate,water dikinase
MIGGPPAEREWKRALVEFGAFDLDEFRDETIDIQGMFHGYIYLNLSQSRTFGARMPGASPELMDRTYLGEMEAPPYTPHPEDDKPEYAERIMATIQRVMSETSRPDIDEHARMAAELRAARPDFDAMSDADLLAYSRRVMSEQYSVVLRTHLKMVYEGSVVTGALDELAASLGDPGLTVKLMGGLGDIASAAPNIAMWDMAQLVKNDSELTRAFSAGTKGLEERLRSSDSQKVQEFLEQFDHFIYQFGSRSTEEWSAMPKSWENYPEIPLAMIGRMRLQSESNNPSVNTARLAKERESTLLVLRDKLKDDAEALAGLENTLRAAELYSRAREQGKSNVIRILHEARMPIWVLAGRHVQKGHLGKRDDLTMLREDELDSFIESPQQWIQTIAERWEWYEELAELEPPFFINGEVPPASTWPRKADPDIQPAKSGETLQGISACGGTATGTARIINAPEDADSLEPGEILIAPMTDPGWTPIFTSAAAVVVNVGSTMSHAAIVSRELGIPCVLGVRRATKRITNGATITVDGTNGTVTVH